MTTPEATEENVAKVRENLRRMQSFNDYVYNNGGAYIGNCYLRMSVGDDSDPGLSVGMSLLEGAFGALTDYGSDLVAAACFMCSEIQSWSSETPPSLQEVFASMAIRYEKSSFQFDESCAAYITDTEANWTKTFSWNGQTLVLGDLANIVFPAEGEDAFYPPARAALKALDQTTWRNVLQAECWITLWTYQQGPKMVASDTDMTAWDEHFISNNPAWYNTWFWHEKKGMFDKDWWYVNEYNLNMGATRMHTNDIPKDACSYLFIDSADGVVINSEGLVPRRTVFETWGIRTSVIDDN